MKSFRGFPTHPQLICFIWHIKLYLFLKTRYIHYFLLRTGSTVKKNRCPFFPIPNSSPWYFQCFMMFTYYYSKKIDFQYLSRVFPVKRSISSCFFRVFSIERSISIKISRFFSPYPSLKDTRIPSRPVADAAFGRRGTRRSTRQRRLGTAGAAAELRGGRSGGLQRNLRGGDLGVAGGVGKDTSLHLVSAHI